MAFDRAAKRGCSVDLHVGGVYLRFELSQESLTFFLNGGSVGDGIGGKSLAAGNRFG
jgi:hypothetical protein